MSRVLLGVFASCCVAGALSARIEEKTQAQVNTKDSKCSSVVGGAELRRSAWRRKKECKCARGFSLVGADSPLCGDGTKRHFKAKTVKDMGCECKENKVCKPVDTQPNFNLAAYIAKPWFIQQQMPTEYLPVGLNFCVNARYDTLSKPSFWGYTIQVSNKASDKDGKVMDSGDFLCAYGYDKKDPAKLAVAPCFVPKVASGNYWVLAYHEGSEDKGSEDEGYALVSGGQPSQETPFGCRVGSGVNDAGLWIFSRDPVPSEGLVQKVRDIAISKGFDISVLNQVDHSSCSAQNYVRDSI